jgi:hypothetical protein
MKNIEFRLICFLLIIFTSCQDKEKLVHVKVINAVTNEGYSGLQFSIIGQREGVFESHYKTEYEGVLNENGEALFDFKMKNSKSYRLFVEVPENNCYYNDLTYVMKHDSSNMHAYFEFAPCSSLKFEINNVNCQGSSDSMRFRNKMSYSDWESWSTDRSGCYAYTSENFFDVPMGWRIYEWEVNRSGVITNFIDSIYLDAGEYGTFVMEY